LAFDAVAGGVEQVGSAVLNGVEDAGHAISGLFNPTMGNGGAGVTSEFDLRNPKVNGEVLGLSINPNHEPVFGNARVIVNNDERQVRVIVPVSNLSTLSNIGLSGVNQTILDPSNNKWNVTFETRGGSLVNGNGDSFTNTVVLDGSDPQEGKTSESYSHFFIHMSPDASEKTYEHELAGHVSGLADVYDIHTRAPNLSQPLNLMNNDNFTSSGTRISWPQLSHIMNPRVNDVIFVTHGTSEPISRTIHDVLGF
jgi:hypothetical protein